MRTLPILAIALLASAPAFAAAPAPAAKHVVVLSAAPDAAAVHDLLAREGYTVATAQARPAQAGVPDYADIDYPSQLGPEGPRAPAGTSR